MDSKRENLRNKIMDTLLHSESEIGGDSTGTVGSSIDVETVKALNLLESTTNNDSEIKDGTNKTDKLTLSFILNLIDGTLEQSDRIVIITTNHKDKIDPALIRPGRVDMCLELDTATRNTTVEILEFFYKDKLTEQQINTLPDKKYTPAEIINLCTVQESLNGAILSISKD